MIPIRKIPRPAPLTALCLALIAGAATTLPPRPVLAAAAPFDLEGPELRVTVTRDGKTLPIAQTPSLAEGDRISIRADLPKSQSTHYVLVAAFLRGVTNPPPQSWFFESQTWKPKAKDGLTVTVPAGAQQMLLFLAPETSGDFKAIVDAVRGRPGAFVQATQNLSQASLDNGRLRAFLTSVRSISRTRPADLKTASSLLARSLSIKLDTACLQQAAEQQASCLTQGQDRLVLNDGHSTSMVQALTSGYSADLVQALSVTPQAGGGYYSPYISSVLALAHVLDSFRTAQFQYIPALETLDGDRLSLLLNAAPSFQTPKSVLVAAMPAIEPPQPPPLRSIAADDACLQNPDLVLGVEGAPLVFSTGYAHDLVLRLKARNGQVVDAPLKAEAEKGGLVVDGSHLDPTQFDETVEGRIQGFWGFEPYSGPAVRLQSADGAAWRVDADDAQALIAGRDGTLRLHAEASGCVRSVALQPDDGGAARDLTWKASGPDTLTVSAALKDAQPGAAKLLVQRYGAAAPDAVPVTVYSAASHLEAFAFHASDRSGVLKGGSPDEVAQLDLNGVVFKPDAAATDAAGVGLVLTATDGDAAAKLKAGQGGKARVRLKNGQVVTVAVTVGPPRPVISLLAKNVQPAASDARIRIALGDPDELPHGAQLTFSLQAEGATAFTGAETLEVATAQGGFSTTLTAANGGFTLQNAKIAVGRLDLGKAFGSSAFGPLRVRLVGADGASDWRPLGVLVRLPILHDLACKPVAEQAEPCQLSGSNLFLIDSMSGDRAFANPVQTPAGFPGNTLPAPQPKGGQLYVRLSDNPAAINMAVIQVDTRSAPRPQASAARQP